MTIARPTMDQRPKKVGADGLKALSGLAFESAFVLDEDGAVTWCNQAAYDLLHYPAGSLAGIDVRDLFYAEDVTRADRDGLPFPADGSTASATALMYDGSFCSCDVRCRKDDSTGAYGLVVASTDELCGLAAEKDRLTAEMGRLRRRIGGTLSIVSAVVDHSGEDGDERGGAPSLGDFGDTVAAELRNVFGADYAALYMVREYGFEPFGKSAPDGGSVFGSPFMQWGVGLPTLLVRNRRPMRLRLISTEGKDRPNCVMLDLDTEKRIRLYSDLALHCSTMLGAPVYSYDQVVACIVVGWAEPRYVKSDELDLVTTVGDYLSVELAAEVSRYGRRRDAGFQKVLSFAREIAQAEGGFGLDRLLELGQELSDNLPCHVYVLTQNGLNKTAIAYALGTEDGFPEPPMELPYGMDELFGSEELLASVVPDDPCGMWIARHTDLSQGYALRFGMTSIRDVPIYSALMVLRGPHDRPFDGTEQTFLRSLSDAVQTTIRSEQERVQDAQIASVLQMGLRNELSKAKGLTGASLYISATAQAMVGGDFFDLYELSDDRVVVVMGDVSGKGVEAAAMASLVKTALAAYAWSFLDPAGMLDSLNTLFLNFSRLETFASMVVVSINVQSGKAMYCSAGHPPAMVAHRGSEGDVNLELLTVQSPIIGAFEGMTYSNGTFAMGRGDVLYLYTDGTTEARNSHGAFFGEESLRDSLLKACRGPVERVPQEIYADVSRFAEGDLHDDIAMVAVRYDGVEG